MKRSLIVECKHQDGKMIRSDKRHNRDRWINRDRMSNRDRLDSRIQVYLRDS